MKAFILLFGILLITGCETSPTAREAGNIPDESEIVSVLDAWHKAAATADFDAYFGYFADDSSIFMGTDETERWTVPQFREYARPHFEAGDAWSFTGHHRHIYFSDDGNTAWFDEELNTPNLGPSRGTGVLVRQGELWKIAHYNLTVPIPNDIVYDVVRRIDSLQQN